MGLLEKIIGFPAEIDPSSDDFGWRTAGIGARYLLVTCEAERPVARLDSTAAESRSDLVNALDVILRNQNECLLLGIETMDLWTKFFRLAPVEARQRLAPT